MIINRKEFVDYSMLVLLVFISGNLAFSGRSILFGSFIMSMLFFIYRKKILDRYFLYFLLMLAVILLLQSLKFNYLPIETYIGVYIRILIAYFILKSIGITFIQKFINVMYYIASISLIFYFSIQIIPNMEQILIQNFTLVIVSDNVEFGGVTRHNVLGLYTIDPSLSFKNAGPFWEMGAFGGYLLIALMFSLFTSFKLKSKKNIILFVTIITTQSTTAYIALFVLFFIFFYKKIKNKLIKYTIIGVFFVSGFYMYTNLGFLGEKIEYQLAVASSVKIDGTADSQRFINILKDWYDYQGHEIIGRGPHSSTRYSFDPAHQIRTVGSTDMIVRYGLPFFILLLYLMYRSMYIYGKYIGKKNKFRAMGMVFILLILLMSETYFLFPLFWVLVFLPVVYKNNVANIDNRKGSPCA